MSELTDGQIAEWLVLAEKLGPWGMVPGRLALALQEKLQAAEAESNEARKAYSEERAIATRALNRATDAEVKVLACEIAARQQARREAFEEAAKDSLPFIQAVASVVGGIHEAIQRPLKECLLDKCHDHDHLRRLQALHETLGGAYDAEIARRALAEVER